MKFYEYILNGFKVIECWHDFVKKLVPKMFEGMERKKYQHKSYGSCDLNVV